MNPWKVIGIVVVTFLAACCAIAVMLFLFAFWWGSRYESPTFSYPNLSSTQEARVIEWMPNFLPAAAKNIKEKRNGENGTSIVAFEFRPDDFGWYSNLLISVPSNRFKEIRPHRVYKQESWFPKAILTGDLNKMTRQGFLIYQSEPDYSGKLKMRWFAAISPATNLLQTVHKPIQTVYKPTQTLQTNPRPMANHSATIPVFRVASIGIGIRVEE